MKNRKRMQSIVAVLAILTAAVSVQAGEFDLEEASLADRMTYHRAIDAAVWAMPLTSPDPGLITGLASQAREAIFPRTFLARIA